MNAADMLEKIGDALGSTATVKSVYGEPIQMEGKVVVPIAKIGYGFGAGGGRGPVKLGGVETQPEGGGGGGVVRAFPAGALEITQSGTRFVPFTDLRWIAGVFAAGALLCGVFLGRRHK
ncbi:MAG TPA: spore germination protein GerW family protein [Bryobacteraceae bacterium]|jgi:uncharacterized spore protein YtfJ|nr:spore germination protein GerW family protein [Bryobacteraceae bacterium]